MSAVLKPEPEMEAELNRRVLERYAKEELPKCKANCSYFINHFVWIEEKGDDPLTIPFRLWPAQEQVLCQLIDDDRLIILKARQLGMTWLVLAFATWKMLFTPGYRVLGFSKTENDALEMPRRMKTILQNLPVWMTREAGGKLPWKSFPGPVWEAKTETITIYHPQDPKSLTKAGDAEFKVFATTGSGGRSYSASLIVLDEFAYAKDAGEIWSSVHATINHPKAQGKAVMLSTMVTGTVFEAQWDRAREGKSRFRPVFLPWSAHPDRDQEWYEGVKSDEPDTYLREYPATPEEAKSAGPDTFFMEFSEDFHVVRPFEVPDWWQRWLSNDPGFTDPFSWHGFAVDPDGNVYVYMEFAREVKDPRLPYSEQAKKIAGMCARRDAEGNVLRDQDGNTLYHKFDFLVTGHDANTKHPETGKAISDYYQQAFDEAAFRVGIIPTVPDRARRAAVMHEYLKTFKDENTGKTRAKLRIFSTCKALIKALPVMRRDEHSSEKYGDHPLDHTVDGLGYGLQQWHPDESKEPNAAKAPVQEWKDSLAQKARMAQMRARYA